MNNTVKELKTPVIVILLFFLCLLVYTKTAGPIPFAVNSVQTTKTDVFQVDGEGKATAAPNTATVAFGVTKQAPTVAAAQDQTNTAVQNILNNLKNIGIDTKNIKTTNYSVQPNYSFGGTAQTITGYTVTQNVEVKIQPLDKVNKTVDTITASGANLVGQVSFGFDDATKQKLEDQARQEAVNIAKRKAEGLAKAAGIHLGSIINVIENQSQPIVPMPMNIAAKLERPAGETQQTDITPGQNTVSTTVTLVYQTY